MPPPPVCPHNLTSHIQRKLPTTNAMYSRMEKSVIKKELKIRRRKRTRRAERAVNHMPSTRGVSVDPASQIFALGATGKPGVDILQMESTVDSRIYSTTRVTGIVRSNPLRLSAVLAAPNEERAVEEPNSERTEKSPKRKHFTEDGHVHDQVEKVKNQPPPPSIRTSASGQKYVYTTGCPGKRVPGSKLFLDRDGFVDVTFESIPNEKDYRIDATTGIPSSGTQTHQDETKPNGPQSSAASTDALTIDAAAWINSLPPKERAMVLDHLVGVGQKRRRTALKGEDGEA